MESYKSNRPESKSLFTAVMTLSVAWYFISIIPLSAQERVDIDTLWYRYHNPEQDYYPDLLPEDCYMELYLVKAPIDRHIRSWQEAMSRYQTWEPFTDRMEDEIQMSISFARWLENDTVRYNMSVRKDTVRVKNLTCPYIDREGKAFVLLKDRTGL